MPARSELTVNRRALLGSGTATLATAMLPRNLFAEAPLQQETKESASRHYVLGQSVNLDSSGKVSISSFPGGQTKEFRLPLTRLVNGDIKISPDGQKAGLWVQTGDGRTQNPQYLFIIDLDSSGPNLAKIWERRGLDPFGIVHFSPDSRWIALNYGSYQSSFLSLIRLAEKPTVTNYGQDPSPASFSPDSRWLTFTTQTQRFIIELDSGKTTSLQIPYTFAIETWSPDSQKLAFAAATDTVWVYKPTTSELIQLGAGIDTLGFSPDSAILVYLETTYPSSRLAILDLNTGRKVSTPSLPENYYSTEIVFLNNQEFRVVSENPTDHQIWSAIIDTATGQTTSTKNIPLPYYSSLFSRQSFPSPDRFVNSDWVASRNYDPTDWGINATSLNTGQTIQIARRGQEQMLTGDFQVVIAQEDQLFRSGNVYNVIKGGKRYKLVGKTFPRQPATPIAEHLINSLAEGKTIFLDGQKRNVFVPGLTSVVEQGGAGTELSRIFVEFQIQSHKLGHRGEHHINMSWAGFEIGSENGLFYPSEQSCSHTFTHPEERAGLLVQFFLDWFQQHPNDQLTVFTHSEGASPALIAINKIKTAKTEDPKYPIDPAKLRFVFTHAPILGLDKPGLENIARLLPWVSQDCKLIGPIPDPAVANQRSVQYLLATWERRNQRRGEIEEDMVWLHAAGGKAESVGYDRDTVIAVRYSNIPDPLLDVLLRLGLISDEPIRTQNLPGGESHMLSIRPRVELGHDMAWRPGPGLDLLLKLAGPQLG